MNSEIYVLLSVLVFQLFTIVDILRTKYGNSPCLLAVTCPRLSCMSLVEQVSLNTGSLVNHWHPKTEEIMI